MRQTNPETVLHNSQADSSLQTSENISTYH